MADVTPPEDEAALDKLREMPVGTEDPNIVGDAGPTDVPPGKDPDPEWPPPDVDEGPGPPRNPDVPG